MRATQPFLSCPILDGTPTRTPGGNGFQHHRTGDAASRTTWMMALGAGVRQGVVYDRPLQSIDLVPSLGAMMGFSACTIARQADQRTTVVLCCHAISKPNSSPGILLEARKLAVANLRALQQLPLSFLPGLLREVIDYDFKFPAERAAIDKELANLSSLSPAQINRVVSSVLSTVALFQAGASRLDQSARPVCRTGIGIPLDHPPTGCVSRGRDGLRRSLAVSGARRAASRAQARNCSNRAGRRVV